MAKKRKGKQQVKKCMKDNSFYQPRMLILYSILSFIFAFVLARTYSALQRAGFAGAPNIIGDFHFHHWSYGLIALLVLIPITFASKNKPVLFGILIILIAFFLGLFIDGIVYEDSISFIETEESVVEHFAITSQDVLVMLALAGGVLTVLVVIVTMNLNKKQKCRIKHGKK